MMNHPYEKCAEIDRFVLWKYEQMSGAKPGTFIEEEQVQLLARGHTVKTIDFKEINENIELPRTGDVFGRAVIRY